MTAKEVDALEAAICKAENDAQKYVDFPDMGPSVFDAPMIRVKATPRQLACMDWQVWQIGKRQPDGSRWFEVDMRLSGQGARLTKMAQIAVESLRASGYDAKVNYQMD